MKSVNNLRNPIQDLCLQVQDLDPNLVFAEQLNELKVIVGVTVDIINSATPCSKYIGVVSYIKITIN